MQSDLLEISDGTLYRESDMVRLGCHDCEGCSECCKDMDQSIVLDPYDIYLLSKNMNTSFSELMVSGKIELHVEEGLLLPNIKMVNKGMDLKRPPECSFLNQEGRCSIHAFRPGICRLFPLGRNYEDSKLSYFLLKDACHITKRDKVKISKWLGYSQIKTYQSYLVEWHDIKAKVREEVLAANDEKYATAVTTGFLKLFFEQPYGEDFFEEFARRLKSL